MERLINKQVKKRCDKKVKINFYLSIYNEIKDNSLSPSDIALKYKLSKQRVQYYIHSLVDNHLIAKIGYGTWGVVSPYKEVKVKKLIHYLAQKGFINITTIKRMRLCLENYGLDKCLFCDSEIYDLHHIKGEHEGGKKTPTNLIPICPTHHRHVHEHGYDDFMKKKIKEYQNIITKLDIEGNYIRGHGFMFHIKIPDLNNWNNRSIYMDKRGIEYTKHKNINLHIIKIKNSTVQLNDHSILIYLGKDFLSKTAIDSKSYAIDEMLQILYKIEQLFQVSFKINKCYRFKVSRQHYGKIRDLLAMQCNKENKKINVYNDGGLWFLIDNSYNLNESETVHPKTATEDMDNVIVPFFNSIKEHYDKTNEQPRFTDIAKIIDEQNKLLISFTNNLNEIAKAQLNSQKEIDTIINLIKLDLTKNNQLKDDNSPDDLSYFRRYTG